ncbi:hypothetical protein CGLO_14495 [Colletotrichum gloeosporioides Cg-14]|uniref:Uncharacterized protein n=1 Tax=Colletotrichum gloeosporioides (strain Cg-14) TaxID=1237896 RepID=T0LDS4_COLGC|nr:hypothetical protein CGLO_14495 [Colletotrichum gloeosporioides Cg-14]
MPSSYQKIQIQDLLFFI